MHTGYPWVTQGQKQTFKIYHIAFAANTGVGALYTHELGLYTREFTHEALQYIVV